jgi:hypothetical protein
MDHDWRRAGWDQQDFAKNHFTPAEFESAVRHALDTSDEFVWVYSEQPRWWTKERLPQAYVDALARARVAGRSGTAAGGTRSCWHGQMRRPPGSVAGATASTLGLLQLDHDIPPRSVARVDGLVYGFAVDLAKVYFAVFHRPRSMACSVRVDPLQRSVADDHVDVEPGRFGQLLCLMLIEPHCEYLCSS